MPFEPKFKITRKINKNLAGIDSVIASLNSKELKDEWLADIQKEAAVLESYHSTHIDGTVLSLEQARDILEGRKIAVGDKDDGQELVNYKEAMSFISQRSIKSDPITEELIKKLHGILIQGVQRESQDREASYVRSAQPQDPRLLGELVQWLNGPQNVSPIVMAAIAQFQLIYIRPFIDGNGRMARLLSILILYKSGYDFKRLFTISETYNKNRSAYYGAMQSVVKNNMDMTSWIEYFIESIEISDHIWEEFNKKGNSSATRSILSSLRGHEVPEAISVSSIWR
jgi:Fic family protein